MTQDVWANVITTLATSIPLGHDYYFQLWPPGHPAGSFYLFPATEGPLGFELWRHGGFDLVDDPVGENKLRCEREATHFRNPLVLSIDFRQLNILSIKRR